MYETNWNASKLWQDIISTLCFEHKLNHGLLISNLMNMNKTSQTNMINNISCESYNHILTNFRIQATVPW